MPSTSSSATGSRLLYFGCEPGEDVLDLQDAFNALQGTPGQGSVFAVLIVDGIFGLKSLARAREFQQRNGLAVDGIVGAQTWGTLLLLLPAGSGLSATSPNGGAGGGPVKNLSGGSAHSKPVNTTGKALPRRPGGAGAGSKGGAGGGGSKAGSGGTGAKGGFGGRPFGQSNSKF